MIKDSGVRLLAVAIASVSLLGAVSTMSPATADRYSSSNYTIDASTMNTFGGTGSSTSYGLVSSGGESIIGSGTGGSYKIGQGYVAQLEPLGPFMELNVQPSNLKAYYPLDETVGTTVGDSSANTHDGTTVNTPTWTTGKIAGGVNFSSASSESISIPDSADFSGHTVMTVSLWANQTSATVNQALISHWDYSTSSASWALQTSATDASKLRFYVAGTVGDTGSNYVDTATGAWSNGSWAYITMVYDGSQANASRVKIYVNGNIVSTTTTGTIATSLVDAVAPLTIGDYKGLNRYWDGGIDNVKLFSRALTAAEISAEYGAQNAGRTAGLSLASVTPGASNSITYDAIVKASTSGYSLSINQDGNLTDGSTTIPAVSGSIASPVAWSEGSTKGLGFTLVTGSGIPGSWNSGNSYAALPGASTTFYTRSGYTPNTKDVLGMRLRLDTAVSQQSGDYTNTMTVIGTTTP